MHVWVKNIQNDCLTLGINNYVNNNSYNLQVDMFLPIYYYFIVQSTNWLLLKKYIYIGTGSCLGIF